MAKANKQVESVTNNEPLNLVNNDTATSEAEVIKNIPANDDDFKAVLDEMRENSEIIEPKTDKIPAVLPKDWQLAPETGLKEENGGNSQSTLEKVGETLEKKTDDLKNPEEWAMEMRLASWQVAAVYTSAGWRPDKRVSRADMENALAGALSRPLG